MIYYLFYNLLFSVVLLTAVPFFVFRMITTKRFREGLNERLGLYGREILRRVEGRPIWIQAASVGEVKAARPLIELLKQEFPRVPVVLTCQTAAGRLLAREQLVGRATAILSPLDLALVIERLIRRISPRILILIETELWPGMITSARRHQVPVAVVNGRISSRSFPRYRMVRSLLKPLLQRMNGFGMRSRQDADRIRALGADPRRVRVTGNIKFDSLDLSIPPPSAGKTLWGWGSEDPVIVAGSTFAGEEELLIKVFRELRADFPGLRMIIAPRHLERVPAVENLLRSAGEEYRLFSLLTASAAECSLVILDRMGVLSELYRSASVVFVGRSLRGSGGQNPIEPAAAGKPILFGPHMENFSEIAEDLIESGGAFRIEDESRLAARFSEILVDPQRGALMGRRARAVVERKQGATRRNLEMIRELIK